VYSIHKTEFAFAGTLCIFDYREAVGTLLSGEVILSSLDVHAECNIVFVV